MDKKVDLLTYSTIVLFWEGELMGEFLGGRVWGNANFERLVSPKGLED